VAQAANAPDRLRILFLCTGNSCRSQMAEGWARALKSDQIDAYSAGTKPGKLDPRAVRAMAESGVDISRQQSKGLAALENIQFDFVITVCDAANETCPVFPGGTKHVHIGFDDPPRLAANSDDDEAMPHYRRVRDEIRRFILTLPQSLESR
jgi:arsenate reductase (thioredoxin)